jgi:hypothetical protein
VLLPGDVFRAHPVETPGNYSLQVLILPFLFLFECLFIQYVIRLSCIASPVLAHPDCRALDADPDPDFTK